jgi:AcrR family transcriptional regulator
MTELELTRRERKKEETKERIFKAALKLFKANGFEGTTIDEIADKADVAKGTFFNYFPRKEAVLGYVPEMWIVEAEEKAATLLTEAGPLGPRMIEMFTEFAEFYEQEPELSRYVITEWTRRMHQGVDEACQRWIDLGVRVVQHLQTIGEMRTDVDARRAHDIIASVYDGTVLRWLSAAPEHRFPLTEELRRRITLVIEGLGDDAKKRP